MSDDSRPHGRPNPSPAPPPPPASSQPPPVPGQPPPPTPTSTDPTGGVAATPRGAPNINLSLELVLGVLGLVGVVLAIFLKESPGQGVPGQNYWDYAGALWALAAIAAAVLALAPALHGVVNLDEKLAWRLGVVGAAFLVFWWVLFVLPNIGVGAAVKNLPFLATVAIALSALAVWTSPGNPYRAERTASR